MTVSVGVLAKPSTDDRRALEEVWERSEQKDDPTNHSTRGGWAVEAWAREVRALYADGQVIGLAALRFGGDGGIGSGRVALDPPFRTEDNAEKLVEGVQSLALEAGLRTLRLMMSTSSTWAKAAIEGASFVHVREIYRMLRPQGASPLPSVRLAPGVTIRAMRPGEEQKVLDALNRAWSGTWNYHEITREMLDRDLEGQREGMLVGVIEDDHVVATCHAIFDPNATNVDGSPRAWISNLTTDPGWQGRGLGRSLLVAGIQALYAHGAQSIGLGVDGGNATPVHIYRSTGFDVVAVTDVWEKKLRS
jgi:mycothiol synthase